MADHRAKTETGAVLVLALTLMVADQKVHRREAMLIVARLVNATVEAIGDRADLRTWITDADLQKVVMLIADQAAAMQKVVNQEVATSLATGHARQATVKVAKNLGLRCAAVVHRSRIAGLAQSGLRGCSMAIVVRHLLAVLHRLVEALSEWDHRGCSMASLSVADRRSVMAERIVTADRAIVMNVATMTDVRNADLDPKVAAGAPTVARKLDVHRDLRTMVVGMAGLRTAGLVITNLVANAAIVRSQLVEIIVRKASVDLHVH